jgi:hypothetical protein
MVTPARSKGWIVLGLVTVVLVGLAIGMLAALQRQLIYFPDSTTVPSAVDVIDGARDVTLRTSDGLALGARFVPARSTSDMHMAVLVAPGTLATGWAGRLWQPS